MRIEITDNRLHFMATTDLEKAYFANLLTENEMEDKQHFELIPFWDGGEPKKAVGFFIEKQNIFYHQNGKIIETCPKFISNNSCPLDNGWNCSKKPCLIL